MNKKIIADINGAIQNENAETLMTAARKLRQLLKDIIPAEVEAKFDDKKGRIESSFRNGFFPVDEGLDWYYESPFDAAKPGIRCAFEAAKFMLTKGQSIQEALDLALVAAQVLSYFCPSYDEKRELELRQQAEECLNPCFEALAASVGEEKAIAYLLPMVFWQYVHYAADLTGPNLPHYWPALELQAITLISKFGKKLAAQEPQKAFEILSFARCHSGSQTARDILDQALHAIDPAKQANRNLDCHLRIVRNLTATQLSVLIAA